MRAKDREAAEASGSAVIYARVPRALHGRLIEVANRSGLTMSSVVQMILSDAFGDSMLPLRDAIAEVRERHASDA